MKKYGISLRQYEYLLRKQHSCCLICGISSEEHGRRFNVDHDHRCCPGLGSCGKCIRGLLCSDCNLGLGAFKDNPDSLRKAAIYLGKGYSNVDITESDFDVLVRIEEKANQAALEISKLALPDTWPQHKHKIEQMIMRFFKSRLP